jgi:hypothetical protein
MAKLKPHKAGKVGHGNTKRFKDAVLLHGLRRMAPPKGSGATAKVPKLNTTGHEERRGLRLRGLRRGSGG